MVEGNSGQSEELPKLGFGVADVERIERLERELGVAADQVLAHIYKHPDETGMTLPDGTHFEFIYPGQDCLGKELIDGSH